MKASIKNGRLIVEIQMNETPVPSSSGKTNVVASSRGNRATDLMIDGKPLTVGLNAYIPK